MLSRMLSINSAHMTQGTKGPEQDPSMVVLFQKEEKKEH